MKNYILLMVLALLSSLSLNAQKDSPKVQKKSKVVVIEKHVDEDGKETTKKMVKEGEDAEKYLERDGRGNRDESKGWRGYGERSVCRNRKRNQEKSKG